MGPAPIAARIPAVPNASEPSKRSASAAASPSPSSCSSSARVSGSGSAARQARAPAARPLFGPVIAPPRHRSHRTPGKGSSPKRQRTNPSKRRPCESCLSCSSPDTGKSTRLAMPRPSDGERRWMSIPAPPSASLPSSGCSVLLCLGRSAATDHVLISLNLAAVAGVHSRGCSQRRMASSISLIFAAGRTPACARRSSPDKVVSHVHGV